MSDHPACPFCRSEPVMMDVGDGVMWPWCKACDFGLPPDRWKTRVAEMALRQELDKARAETKQAQDTATQLMEELRKNIPVLEQATVYLAMLQKLRHELYAEHNPIMSHASVSMGDLCPKCLRLKVLDGLCGGTIEPSKIASLAKWLKTSNAVTLVSSKR